MKALVALAALAGIIVITGLSVVSAAAVSQCECDYDAERVSRAHALAWLKVHEGVALDDDELQALSDAQEILKCVAGVTRR